MGKEFKAEFNKRVYRYALQVIRFVDKMPKDQASQVLAKQLIRSGTSVTANVIEAQAASSKKDYINFYTHSLKSANETKLWIGLIRDSERVQKDEADVLFKETEEIAKILGASIITMKKNKV